MGLRVLGHVCKLVMGHTDVRSAVEKIWMDKPMRLLRRPLGLGNTKISSGPENFNLALISHMNIPLRLEICIM
jgi:hypothetical protein